VLRLGRDGDRPYLRLEPDLPLYLGQYVAVEPRTRYRLDLDLRAETPGAKLILFFCEKSLLYAFACSKPSIAAEPGVGWRHYEVAVDSGRLGSYDGRHRPVEFAIAGAPRGARLDVAGLSLRGPSGAELIANGNFAHGTDRWLFSDDSHNEWRIENEGLMRWFEQGWLGVASWATVVLLTLVRLLRRIRKGDIRAAPFLASLLGFLMCGALNSLLEAPRLATLFCLVLLAANVAPRDGDSPAGYRAQPGRASAARSSSARSAA